MEPRHATLEYRAPVETSRPLKSYIVILLHFYSLYKGDNKKFIKIFGIQINFCPNFNTLLMKKEIVNRRLSH